MQLQSKPAGPAARDTEQPGRMRSSEAIGHDVEKGADRIAASAVAGGRPLLPAGGVALSPERTSATGGWAMGPALVHEAGARLNHDFSHVRIHADEQAADAARRLGAHAFTVGVDIVFGAGKFDPGSLAGSLLLAHELGHVIQHGAGMPGVHRWADCRPVRMSAIDCPEREPGETRRAASGAMPFLALEGASAGGSGALVANFDIGKSRVKRSLASAIYWKQFLNTVQAGTTYWSLVGFSDCHEDGGSSAELRKGRAEAVREMLPEGVRSRILETRAAPDGQCVTGNDTLSDRASNRSVAIVREHTQLDFGPEEGEQIEVEPYDPAKEIARCQSGAAMKTFPFRTTRFGGAPLMTRRDGEKIVVEMPMHVHNNGDFRREVQTLPLDTFIDGAELRRDEVVRVRHYQVPHWYNLNITGDASGDKKTEYCVTGEQMLEFGKASHRATLVNIAVTGVEAVAPAAGKLITTPLTNAGKKAGQNLLLSGMLGTARVTSPTIGGAASREAVAVTTDRVAAAAVERTVTQAASREVAANTVARVTPVLASNAPRIAPAASGTVGSVAGVTAANVGGGVVRGHLDDEVDAAFAPTGDFPGAPYQTSHRLMLGNTGERLATDALAANNHTILSFKPSILGTNQGGIDIVTMRNGVVNFIDNKALTRTGNINSVSALTTNFNANKAAVLAEFEAYAANQALPAAERALFQQAAAAIRSGNFARVVTNANISRNGVVTSGVSKRLSDIGITFLDVMP